ncbi:MAG: superfamily helicase [Nevskia sp.]|nr:superfamily helicase [Nevskia sp.]
MRIPKITELDREQESIYEGAPREGTILIIGPPGTGKTVIAFHRADYLAKLGQAPRVLMYNKVLRQFASERGDLAGSLTVQTVHQWIAAWWRSSMGKAAVPHVGSDTWHHDWPAIEATLVPKILKEGSLNRSSWGHLLIDEGQDLPPQMYAALNVLMHMLNAVGAALPAAITVLADDNQRLQPGQNSTVEDIRQALGLHEADKNVFFLRRNYRNTFEIASFAAKFYVGLSSGIPELPEGKRGALPTVFLGQAATEDLNLSLFAARIANFAKARGQEIGVFVPNNKLRKKMLNRIVARVGDSIKVQTYAANDDDARAEDLKFDQDGYITVLNYASAKGLEFETVFIIDPMGCSNGKGASVELQMALYVLCSRGRSGLTVMVVDEPANTTFFNWIGPAEGSYKMERLS